jgi:hypothetical protein
MTIQVPQDTKQINPNAKDDGIQLPFVAPIFYWTHGKKILKSASGVAHFGGWETQEDDLFLSEFSNLPNGFAEEERHFGSVVAGRALTVAPIKTRKRWTDRSHSQTLCLVAAKNDAGKLEYLGVVVLSAKGYATQYLSNAFRAWKDHSADARRQWATVSVDGKDSVLPSWYFWQSIGTYGEFSSDVVGKGNKTSETTQPDTFLPAISNGAQLESLYVGEENYRLMAQLSGQAEEWANDERWLKGEEQLIEQAAPQYEYREPEEPEFDDPFPL